MVATFGSLSFTKYSDGSCVMKIVAGNETIVYKHLTSAQVTTLNTEIDGAGIAGAPSDDGNIPLVPLAPQFTS